MTSSPNRIHRSFVECNRLVECLAQPHVCCPPEGDVACLIQAGRVRGSADFVGDSAWERDIGDLLKAAALAGFGASEA